MYTQYFTYRFMYSQYVLTIRTRNKNAATPRSGSNNCDAPSNTAHSLCLPIEGAGASDFPVSRMVVVVVGGGLLRKPRRTMDRAGRSPVCHLGATSCAELA